MNSGYSIFLVMAFLFAAGSIIGYGVEVVFRRVFSAHRWTNPGYLFGPFLPLYGFGVLAMYFLSLIPINTGRYWLNSIIIILIIGFCMTAIEYLAGLIFIKGIGIKLWDYANMRGNIQGIICPLFSLIWTVVGSMYYFFLHKYFVIAIDFFMGHTYYIQFWLGCIYGFLVFDIIASSNAVAKIAKAAKKSKIVISYEEYKIGKSEKKKERKQQFLKENPYIEEFIATSKKRSDELIGRIIYKDQSAKHIKAQKAEAAKDYSFSNLKKNQGIKPQDLKNNNSEDGPENL